MGLFGTRLGLTRYEADEYYGLALAAYKKNNLDDAVHNINAAIELFPRRAEYYAARGFFRLEDGLYDLAEPDFDQALQLHNYDVLGNYGKAVIAYNRKHYETAHVHFTNAWAADPQRPETLYYLALTEHRLRNNSKAHNWMQQAATAYAALAENNREAKKRKGNADKWLKAFERLIKKAQKSES